MTANKTIIISVTLYVIILAIMYILFSNQQFTGGDAAGNGMEKGLTFYYGLAVFFLIAVILTIVNAFFFKDLTSTWIRSLFFIPILLPLLIVAFNSLEIGKSKRTPISEQLYWLTFEIRTPKKLDDATLSFKSSKGGSSSKLKYKKTENNFHFYERSNAIYHENNRTFRIRSDEFKTLVYHLEIPFEPKIIPFTNWRTLDEIKMDGKDPLKLEFRYKITK